MILALCGAGDHIVAPRSMYAESARLFRERLPSYRILYNIGQVQQQLSQFAKALASLERYLAEGEGKIPDDRRAIVS